METSKTLTTDLTNHPERRIRLPELQTIVPYSTASIYAKMANGTFPKAQKMGGRAVAWRLGDILDWLNNRPVASDIQEVTQ